nr:MobF family relaxase [Corynebacterium lactis]
MMSIRVVNAGDGYAYLLRNVATADVDTSVGTRLGDYYQETGTPPGRWFGRGIAGLHSTVVTDGSVVDKEHMAALYGEGLHPEADAKIAAGAAIADVQLGRAYPIYSGGDEVLAEIAKREKQFRYEQGRRPDTDERNTIAVDTARAHYTAATGFDHASPREILAWVNEKKNSVRQATAGFDLTFSPAKSISVLWALGDDDTRKTIESVHAQCVNDTLDWVDQTALRTRCEVAGVKQLTRTRGLIAAQFVHYDTRSGDPDLHTHCLISNKVQGPDGKWRSVDSRSLMASAVSASTHYNALMMQRLREELGLSFTNYESDPAKLPVWEVAGVDPSLLAHFSKRRLGARPRFEQLCADYRANHGRSPGLRATRKLWQKAVLDTRPNKDEARSLAQLCKGWREEIAAEFGTQVVADIVRSVHAAQDARAAAPAVDSDNWVDFVSARSRSALALAVSRRSEFRRHHLRTAVEQDLAQFDFPTATARAQATDVVLRRALNDAIRLTPQASYRIPGRLLGEDGELFDRSADQIVYTTAEVIAAENTVLESTVEPTAHIVTNAEIDAALDRHQQLRGFALNTGQEALARHLVATGMQTVAGVGPAGTGKTASMAVVADIWRSAGHEVFAFAPSAVAATTLGEDIGETGHTLARATYMWRGKIGTSPRSIEAVEHVLGRKISAGDMLLVDEAGMASTDDLAAIVEIAEATGAVVRMVGDPYQLDAVETGGLFRTVCKRTSAVELDQVMRQGDDAEQATAGLAIRRGDPTGLELYHHRGWIAGGTSSHMIDGAVAAWLADFDRGRTSLLVASTNAVVAEANSRIQAEMIRRGTVQAQGSWLARLLRRTPPHTRLGDGHTAFIGDTILTRNNHNAPQPDGTTLRVLNGQKWTIDHIDRDGAITAINAESGRSIILDSDYVRHHCQLGYASTIHRAQGVTVDCTHAVVDASTDRRGLYVALTRGKHENRLWTITDPRLDEAEEAGHLHMDGDAEPATAMGVLERIVAHDSGHITASDLADELAEKETSTQRRTQLYRAAVAALADDYATVATDEIIDGLPVDIADALGQDDIDRIRQASKRAGLRGVDVGMRIDQVSRLGGNERDVAAVVSARIDQLDGDDTGLAVPPVTSHTDLALHGFAVELAAELADENHSVTVTKQPEEPAVSELSAKERLKAQLREKFRARVADAAMEAAAEGAARRAAEREASAASELFAPTLSQENVGGAEL